MQEMKDHISYLKARLHYCLQEAQYNHYQAEAYKKFIETAESSADFKDYISKLGNDASFFSAARAESADRAAGQLKIAEENGDKKTAAVWRECLDSILNARDHSALFNAYENGRQAAEKTGSLVRDQMNAALELLTLLTLWRTEPDSLKKGREGQILSCYVRLMELDPEFTWKHLSSPPYSRFFIYEPQRRDILKSWMDQITGKNH